MTERKYQNFSVTHDEADVVRVVLDVPGRPMNVIDESLMEELEQIIGDLEDRDDVRLVVFKSGKESGFLAGADINVIAGIGSAQQAAELVVRGQDLFDRIERLAMPTLAMIHGPCLGGGLELSLACNYRIARDNSHTRIGLPEIKLGLIPGWGGTQRLPRLVGMRHAIDLILTGKHMSASAARRIGLIDRAIAPDRWRDEVTDVIVKLVTGQSLRPAGQSLLRLRRCIEDSRPLRQLTVRLTRRRIAGKVDHYPAIEAALHAIADSYRHDIDGLLTEREEFAALVETETSKQLVGLFLSRERARNLTTWCPEASRTVYREPIRKLGVVGCGAMGAGIAQVAATKGFPVCIKEVDAQAVVAGTARIDRLVAAYADHKRMTPDDRKALGDLIDVSATFGAFKDVDCVVEAVVERMDVKKSVLSEAERAVVAGTILATNTSALSVSEMAGVLQRPRHFAGLHFFNPVHQMELVEVVRGDRTSESTVARLVSFVKAIGKTPVVTKDSPGFLVNRILFPYLGEAVLMVRQGYRVETIDHELRTFGMPMGPLELLDRVGLDVAVHVAETLREVLSGVEDVMAVLRPMVDQGHLGTKSKIGFYDHSGKHKRPRSPEQIVGANESQPVGFEFARDGLSLIQRRLVYPMLAEAVRCQREHVVEHRWAIDLAMVLGTGFAPHRGGPLNLLDQITTDVFSQNLFRLKRQLGDRFQSPWVDSVREQNPLSKGAGR